MPRATSLSVNNKHTRNKCLTIIQNIVLPNLDHHKEGSQPLTFESRVGNLVLVAQLIVTATIVWLTGLSEEIIQVNS